MYRRYALSLESLRPDEFITDAMFDELRDGVTRKSEYLSTFATAEELRKAIANYEQTHTFDRSRYHTLRRMFRTWEQHNYYYQSMKKKKAETKIETDVEELKWSRAVQRAERRAGVKKAYSTPTKRRREQTEHYK